MNLRSHFLIFAFCLLILNFAGSRLAFSQELADTTASQANSPSNIGASSLSVPLRYFEKEGDIDRSAHREFTDLYNKFKNNPALADSQTALQRVLAFYAKNKNGIPKSCGGDMDATSSPREEKLDAISKVDNQDFILLVDYTIPHVADRFFILDVKTGKVESCPAAHGYGSNPDCPSEHQIRCPKGRIKCKIPATVKNVVESGATSRGFYLTDEGYRSSEPTFNGGSPESVGQNALNLRGLIGGVNDNALKRSVVFHRASYSDNLCSTSAGCPAICPQLFEDYKDKVKRALMYVHTNEDEERDQPDC